MQLIDHEDPRPAYVKIAASIRASILSGEVRPGEQLPTGKQLAARFGVTRPTIGAAVRVLRTEGYVRAVPGGGVYVTSAASVPVPADEVHPLAGLAGFVAESGHLKMIPRAGWLLLGIRHPESVAEHSYRVAVIGVVLAALEQVDVGRVAALCIFHDLHEVRIGDVPAVGRAYVTTAVPQVVTSHQVAGVPDEVGKVVQALTDEYESAPMSRESRVAHDADKLETLIQAREYECQGYATGPWQDTSIQSLRTDAGRQLGRAILAADPREWWQVFSKSYAELRASTRARQGLPAEE